MKKIYLCVVALSIGSLSFGQTAVKKAHPLRTETNSEVVKQLPTEKPKGALIWDDDFSTASNWTMTNTSTPSTDWVITTNVNAAPWAALNPAGMTTAASGYAIINSDAQGASGSQNALIFSTTPFSTLGIASVSLTFQQTHRRFQEQTIVIVSNDNGVNWTEYEVNLGMAANSSSPNPQTITVNISSAAANQAAVLVGFKYVGAFDWFWAVDDVEVRESDDNDLVAKKPYYGFNTIPYSAVPSNQIQPVDFAMEVDNVGAQPQTQTQLTATVDGGAFIGTSAPVTVPVGGSDSLFTTTQYTPPTTIATHNVVLSIAASGVDVTPSNNTITPAPFRITQNVYAMDDFTLAGNAGGLSPSNGSEFEAGNYFEIVNTTIATGIEVIVGTTTAPGTNVDFVLYEDNGSSFVEIDRSGFYTTTLADQGNSVILPLPTTPTVTAGNFYFAAVHAFSNFVYGVSGSSPGNSSLSGAVSLIFYPNMTSPNTNENFFTTATPMVRLLVNNLVSVKELSANTTFNVFPNPSNAIFNINLDAKNTEVVNLTVTNIVGQSVLSKRVTVSGQTKETISLAGFDKGIYFLTIDNNNEKQTVKLIVE
ncbi:MAG: hypothetical protein CVT95_03000 [Bacteroidetes bacterium HGW-Bacteroidetes-12]|nr:MAG: hypothetical protein CVT95_03000 [Bacteroidetes bacterium HGW-Bacteroidetes-12]